MNNYDLENQLVIATVKTLDTLYAEENGADAVALYFFYYKTAKKQGTYQIRATQNFCMKGLGWGDRRFRDAKAVLDKFSLVEVIKSSSKWYIKLNYVKRNLRQNAVVGSEPNLRQKEVLHSEGTNALNNINNINALNTLTNVRDGNTPNRGVPCPLLSVSSLKEKWPKGHVECAEYVTSFKFVNKGKQFKFLHSLLRAGFDFPDIDKIIARVEKKPFYKENGWDFATLASEADRSSNARA